MLDRQPHGGAPEADGTTQPDPGKTPTHPKPTGSAPGRVLLLENDAATAQTLTRHLQTEGFCVGVGFTAGEAFDCLEGRWPDLVVLNLHLPGGDGQAVFTRLRQTTIPVVLISGSAQQVDRVAFLNLGADDFVPLPIAPSEVVARVRSVLRRARRPMPPDQVLSVGPLVLDQSTRRVRCHGRTVTLTGMEAKLLAHLMHHPGEVFDRSTLLERVWGYTFGDVSTVTVHVRRLREKIEDDPAHPKLVHTIWGVGYRFQPEGD